MAKNSWETLEDTKKIITRKTQKKLFRLYQEAANDIAQQLKVLEKSTTSSAALKKVILEQHLKQIQSRMSFVQKNVRYEIRKNVEDMATATFDASARFMGEHGLHLSPKYFDTADKVVKNVLNGDIYKGDWNYSKALWKQTQHIKKDINYVVAKGIAENKSIYDISNDLKRYVDPSAAKDWEWSKVYPHTAKRVDYNAQRLARTLIQHSYQQAYKESVKHNPFIEASIWVSAAIHGRTCSLCMDRDGKKYAKGLEPLDHPNGLCWLEPYIPKSMSDIAEELSDWVNGAENNKLDLWYANSMGLNSEPRPKKLRYLNHISERSPVPLQHSVVKTLSKSWGKSPTAVVKQLNRKLDGIIEASDVVTYQKTSALTQALKEGKLKSIHEVGSGSGLANSAKRLEFENKIMNVPKNLPPEDRPIYGMLKPKFTTANVEDYKESVGVAYGDCVVFWDKDSIKKASTFTVGDSISNQKNITSASLLEKADIRDMGGWQKALDGTNYDDEKEFNSATLSDLFGLSKKGSLTENYIEVQIHGEEFHSTKQIQQVLFLRPPEKEAIELLEKQGISWYY